MPFADRSPGPRQDGNAGTPRRHLLSGLWRVAALSAVALVAPARRSKGTAAMAERIALPKPARDGGTSVEAALSARRSHREFTGVALSVAEAARLLWAADGINRPGGYRTAPSAGALYPLEVYLIAGNVEGVASGIWTYARRAHALVAVSPGDRRRALARAAFHQSWIAEAAAIVAIAAVPERTAAKYGARAARYVPIEVGHAAQNVYLQAGALGLGTTVVGAFDDDEVKAVVGMARDEHPMCLLPIGRVR